MSRGEMRPTGAQGGRRSSHAKASPSSTGAPFMTRTLKRGVALPPGDGDVFGGRVSGDPQPPQRYGLSDDRASPEDDEALPCDGQDVLAEGNRLSEGGGFDVGDWGSSNLRMPAGTRRMRCAMALQPPILLCPSGRACWSALTQPASCLSHGGRVLQRAKLTTSAWRRCRASNGSGLPSQGRSGTSLAPMIEHQTHTFSAYSERGGGVRSSRLFHASPRLRIRVVRKGTQERWPRVCVWCTQAGRTGRGSSSLVDRAAQIERQQEAQFAYRANKLLQHFDAQENKRVSVGLRAAQIREPSVRARRPRRLSQRETVCRERCVAWRQVWWAHNAATPSWACWLTRRRVRVMVAARHSVTWVSAFAIRGERAARGAGPVWGKAGEEKPR